MQPSHESIASSDHCLQTSVMSVELWERLSSLHSSVMLFFSNILSHNSFPNFDINCRYYETSSV